MKMNIEDKIVQNIAEIVKEKYGIEADENLAMVEIPKDNTKGDYSTNIAMRLTKLLKRAPKEIAEEFRSELLNRLDEVQDIEIAGPGFINFWLKKDAMAGVINTVIDAKDEYGHSNAGNGLKVLEEYVSANPTGPLHCGHARGACWGDSCVRIMKAAGYDALREYYINDAGAQILNLGKSILARYRELYGLDFTLPEDGYHGPDVIEITKEINEMYGDKYIKMPEEEAVAELKEIGKKMELERIKKDLEYFGCEFDSWVSEQWIVDQGMVDKAIEKMDSMGLLYEKDGAVWFAATKYGDDKDRVLRKSDGYYTYMTPDIANHLYKYDRGYELLVNIWGADHHGYIPRMKAAMEALGYPRDNLQVDICQMVRMIENGQEVKMSKRTGNAITLRELVDDIGIDSARYFFLSKALDTHLDFDLTLARTKSNDNPVYYVQYAYARICSVLKQADKKVEKQDTYTRLSNPKEVDLLKHINSFTEVVAEAAATRSPNKICNYVYKLATYFHSFYSSCKINDKNDPQLTNERLALAEATRITLKNALYLLGVNAPEVMEKEEKKEVKKEEVVVRDLGQDEEFADDGQTRFIIRNDFWKLFPEAKIGIIVCKGINNKIEKEDQYSELLRNGEKECLKYLPDAELSKNRVISVWRDAFSKFKTKKGARSSIEALLKRVYKGNHIGNINPLVDIYNSVSLKYAMPCGGEDIDKFVGNICLTMADGNEEFVTYGGDDENESPYAGEICYKDDQGAICRCWNWREGVRTMLTEDTKNAFMIIELVDPSRTEEFETALNELSELISKNLGGENRIEILDIDKRNTVL